MIVSIFRNVNQCNPVHLSVRVVTPTSLKNVRTTGGNNAHHRAWGVFFGVCGPYTTPNYRSVFISPSIAELCLWKTVNRSILTMSAPCVWIWARVSSKPHDVLRDIWIGVPKCYDHILAFV